MEKITNISGASTPVLCGLIFAAVSVLIGRAYLCTVRALKAAGTWLKARHNFADRDDPVIMTGYQYIFFGLVVCLVCMILSLRIN